MRTAVSPSTSRTLLLHASADLQSVEEGIDKLRALFPDATLLAALDLVDRESGVCLSLLHHTRGLTSLCSAQV